MPTYREPLPEYLTSTEVAEMRRVSVDSLAQERWRKPYTGPAYVKDGRRILYPRVELEAWLDARRHESATRAS